MPQRCLVVGVAALPGGYPALVTDLNPRAQHEAQATIQQVVDELAAQHGGDGVELVRAALAERLAGAGLPEQPEKWMSDTAAESTAGRRLVVDRTRRDEDDPGRAAQGQVSPHGESRGEAQGDSDGDGAGVGHK
jgi:hypothetical protein